MASSTVSTPRATVRRREAAVGLVAVAGGDSGRRVVVAGRDGEGRVWSVVARARERDGDRAARTSDRSGKPGEVWARKVVSSARNRR
jgi:hypothetical protein